MDYLMVYLWTKLDVLSILFGMIGVFLVVIQFVLICYALSNDEKPPFYAKIFLPFGILLIVLFILIPNKTDALLIYFIPKIAHSEFTLDSIDIINKLPKALQKEINEYLKK